MPLDVNDTADVPLRERILRHSFRKPEHDFGLSDSPTVFEIAEHSLGGLVWDSQDEPTVVSVCKTHKAIVRADTSEMVGVVSQSYQPLRNEHLFSTIEEAIRIAVPEELLEGVMVRDRVAHGGSWCQREYVLPAYSEALVNTQFKTEIGLRIVAWNSYDGSASAGLMTGIIDFWCTNGMVVGRSLDRELRRHTTRLSPMQFVPGLRANLGNIHEEIDTVRKMSQTPLDRDLLVGFLEKNMSGQRAAEMLRRVGVEAELRGETVQAVQAALSYYASHSDDAFQVRNADPAREARMLRGREDEVMRLIRTPEWAALVAA